VKLKKELEYINKDFKKINLYKEDLEFFNEIRSGCEVFKVSICKLYKPFTEKWFEYSHKELETNIAYIKDCVIEPLRFAKFISYHTSEYFMGIMTSYIVNTFNHRKTLMMVKKRLDRRLGVFKDDEDVIDWKDKRCK